MTITIKEVTNRRLLREFVNFPFKLYRDNPYWVPTLRSDDLNTLRKDKNPAFAFCQAKYWLAYKDGKIAGRIAGIINPRYQERWGNAYARFGWIDFINDDQVSQSLLSKVEEWAQEQGMQAVHGPLGFTDMDPEAMLVEGFDEMGTLIGIYNYPYYQTHLEKTGYVKDTDWIEFEIKVPAGGVEKIKKLAEIVEERYHLHYLNAKNKKELLQYAQQLFELLEEAYQDLYGVTPLSQEQINTYIDQYLGLLSPEFIPIVLDESNKMVAFGIAMPSLSQALRKSRGRLFPFGFLHLLHALHKNNKGDLCLIAIRKDFQGKGINSMLMTSLLDVFAKMGITSVESNPELEDNIHVQAQWKHFETRQHKRRRVFIKTLEKQQVP
ncbi:MAG: GNAT family N-acetyltransferase [Pelolinea sp.]|jgi:GNAT superfamily N-acetyltransferase|nr:GNAT family N-acetyltransferase [Pelolinea sp.]